MLGSVTAGKAPPPPPRVDSTAGWQCGLWRQGEGRTSGQELGEWEGTGAGGAGLVEFLQLSPNTDSRHFMNLIQL